jgi:hypothetical protein
MRFDPLAWLLPRRVSDEEVRAEIWRLGARHRGWPLEGALQDLKVPGLPAHRALVLRACIRKLQSI